MDAPFTYAHLERVLGQTSLATGASELHGLVMGYLCGDGRADGWHLLEALQLEADSVPMDGPLAGWLAQASAWYRGQLDQLHPAFEPLLPEDARPLAERVDAMVEWTRGFLGGFGLAGARADVLSADGREVMHDLATIAAAQLTLDAADGSAAEDDESALMELVEFVRVGALLLHTEVATATRGKSVRH